MKPQIARTLRKIAAKFDPDPIRSLDVEWKCDHPPYVDIELVGGNRVNGYVYPELHAEPFG